MTAVGCSNTNKTHKGIGIQVKVTPYSIIFGWRHIKVRKGIKPISSHTWASVSPISFRTSKKMRTSFHNNCWVKLFMLSAFDLYIVAFSLLDGSYLVQQWLASAMAFTIHITINTRPWVFSFLPADSFLPSHPDIITPNKPLTAFFPVPIHHIHKSMPSSGQDQFTKFFIAILRCNGL